MKFSRKATIFCLSLACCLSFGFAVGCSDDNAVSSPDQSASSNLPSDNSSQSGEDNSQDSSSEEELAYTYRVSVQNPTGFGLSKVPVSLYDGETLLASAETNVSGYAYFRSTEDAPITLGKYNVVVDELPAGYTYLNDETYTTVEVPETTVEIPLTPTGVLSGAPVAGTVYKLGDVVHDFTAITSDNSTWTLSEILKEKQLAVINFWATWCTPCKSEFPVMNKVLVAYQNSVDCLAISTTDSKDAVASYKASAGLGFDMAGAGAGNNLAASFAAGSAIPQTVMIDRYGVVVFNHAGAITNEGDWKMLFETFIGDDYTPTVWGHEENGGNGGGTDVPEDRIEPTLSAPSIADVHTTLGTTNETFSYRWQAKDVFSKDDPKYDPYSWPWVIKSETDEDGNTVNFLSAGNTVVPTDDGQEIALDSTYATLYADFTATAGDVLVFDYKVGSEKNCDILYVVIDGVVAVQLSGYQTDNWNTCYAYVFTAEEEGEHEVAFLFNKDADLSAYGNIARIANLRIETTGDSIVDAENAYIIRYAATVLNTDENATTQFKNYVNVMYNEEDGYYHVNKVDGPILFADLWYSTQWSNMSVWMLAFNDYCVVEGFNYKPIFEQYTWEANNNIIGDIYMHGLTPVTQELKELLQMMTEYAPYTEEWDKFDGPYHENEWLEICCYYQPYGKTEQLEDPLKTLTFHAAEPVYEGDNMVDVPFAMNPRGFKYKFIPERSGAYRVRSTGNADTVAFLVANDRTTFLGEWDNKLIAESWVDENGVEITDGNFDFFWYFEAGETYYMLFTTFLDQPATYNVNIEYLGETYTYMENAATQPYSANLVTGELFIPNAVDFAYDATYVYDEAAHAKDSSKGIGCYRYVDENGNMGSPLYLDTNRPTSFSERMSLIDKARADREIEVIEDRELYINGVDYTLDIMRICLDATTKQEGIYYGFAVVTKEVYDILYALTVYSAHEGIYNSWLLLCYYEVYLGANA